MSSIGNQGPAKNFYDYDQTEMKAAALARTDEAIAELRDIKTDADFAKGVTLKWTPAPNGKTYEIKVLLSGVDRRDLSKVKDSLLNTMNKVILVARFDKSAASVSLKTTRNEGKLQEHLQTTGSDSSGKAVKTDLTEKGAIEGHMLNLVKEHSTKDKTIEKFVQDLFLKNASPLGAGGPGPVGKGEVKVAAKASDAPTEVKSLTYVNSIKRAVLERVNNNTEPKNLNKEIASEILNIIKDCTYDKRGEIYNILSKDAKKTLSTVTDLKIMNTDQKAALAVLETLAGEGKKLQAESKDFSRFKPAMRRLDKFNARIAPRQKKWLFRRHQRVKQLILSMLRKRLQMNLEFLSDSRQALRIYSEQTPKQTPKVEQLHYLIVYLNLLKVIWITLLLL